MTRDRKVSERLWLLCDTAIEGEPENVASLMAEMSREELETVLAEAVNELLDANTRADREIKRFQRRNSAKHS